MSWSIEEHIGDGRPWPAEVVVYRGETSECLAYASGEVVDRLEDESAKLRELVQKMMRFFEDGDWCDTCECAKECDEQEQYEDDCLMRDVFHDSMRELGIEVDG